MKSKIRIEFDFDTKEPVLQITTDCESDDLRDKMLKSFLEAASHGTLDLTYNTANVAEIKVKKDFVE